MKNITLTINLENFTMDKVKSKVKGTFNSVKTFTNEVVNEVKLERNKENEVISAGEIIKLANRLADLYSKALKGEDVSKQAKLYRNIIKQLDTDEYKDIYEDSLLILNEIDNISKD